MKKNIFFIALIAGLLLVNVSHAWEFDLDGDIRLRNEHDGRDFNADTDMYHYSLLKTRVNFHFTDYEDIEVFAQLMDSRVFGVSDYYYMNESSNSDINFGLHQAYFRAWNLFTEGLGVMGGRFELDYGNGRIFSPDPWHNVGTVFDGGQLFYGNENLWFDLTAVIEHEEFLQGNEDDQCFYSLYGGSEEYPIEAFAVWQLDKSHEVIDADTLNEKSMMTFGVYSGDKIDEFDYDFNFAYQTGKCREAGTEYDIAAYMLQAEVGYLAVPDYDFRIAAGADITSGDDDLTDTDEKNWTELYYDPHKFHGYMDLPALENNARGLMDIYGSLSGKPTENTYGKLDFHLFSTMQDYEVNGEESKSIGTELDIILGCNAVASSDIQVGISMFMGSEDWIGEDADNAMWYYIQWITDF